MKKLFILAVLVTASTLGFSQTSKSTWLLGGSAGFNFSKMGDAKSSEINLSPRIGYFFMDNLAVGAQVGFNSDKPSGGDADTYFGAGPFVRYYFTDMGKNAKLFGHAEFGFGSFKSGGGPSVNATNWGIYAGPAFFLNPSIALEATVGYGQNKSKGFDATGTFGVNFGFQIHFAKK